MSDRDEPTPRVVFEYALLRVVPDIDRGECLNVGVLVYCQPADLLVAAVHLDAARLAVLAPGLDLSALQQALDGIHQVCAGSGPAAGSSPGQRFRWLTSPRSTMVQTGPAHAGLTREPAAEPERLLDLLVR